MPDPPGQESPPSPWNLPNALSLLRLLLAPVIWLLLVREDGADTWSRVAAFVVFALAMATDRIDGEIARRRGIVTDFGKLVDPIADKAVTGVAFVGLSVLGELWWWVTVLVLGRELLVTAMRFVVIRHGVIAASRGGKLKTMLQTVALGLYILPLPSALEPVAITVMVAAVAVTVLTGFDYAARASALRAGAGRP